MGWGTHCGILKYTTMNDDCWSLFVVWLPHRPQRRGTWMPWYRGQWWGHVSLLTSAPYCCTSFVRPLVVGPQQLGLCLLYEKRNGRGESLTWMNVDGDDNLCHHHLDDMAHLLTCPVVAISHHPSSVTWHCHVVIVVGVLWWFRKCQLAVVIVSEVSWNEHMTVYIPLCHKMHNDEHCSSSFGCHVAESDVEPAFCVGQISCGWR